MQRTDGYSAGNGQSEMGFYANGHAGAGAGDQTVPQQRPHPVGPRDQKRQRRQHRDQRDMLTLAECLRRQDCQRRKCQRGGRRALPAIEQPVAADDVAGDREADQRAGQHQGIDHDFRRQAERPRQGHSGQIEERRSRRIKLDQIDVETLPVENFLGQRDLPTHVGVGADEMAHRNRRRNDEREWRPRHQGIVRPGRNRKVVVAGLRSRDTHRLVAFFTAVGAAMR